MKGYELNNRNEGPSPNLREVNEGITVYNSEIKPVSRYGIGKRAIAVGVTAGMLFLNAGCGSFAVHLNREYNLNRRIEDTRSFELVQKT